jgi:hypothetical protein
VGIQFESCGSAWIHFQLLPLCLWECHTILNFCHVLDLHSTWILVKSSTCLWLKISESLMGSNRAPKSRLWHETHYHGNDNWKILPLENDYKFLIKEPWLHNVYWKALAKGQYTCWPWGFGLSIFASKAFPMHENCMTSILASMVGIMFFSAQYAFCTPKCMSRQLFMVGGWWANFNL